MLSKGSENNKTNYNNYRLSTPIIKNRVIKKLLNINKSKEIVLKSSSLKKLNDKNSIIDTEKKIKNKSKEIAFIFNFFILSINLTIYLISFCFNFILE